MNSPGIQAQHTTLATSRAVPAISAPEWDSLFWAVLQRLTHTAALVTGVPLPVAPDHVPAEAQPSGHPPLESPSVSDALLDCVHALEQLHVALCTQRQQGADAAMQK